MTQKPAPKDNTTPQSPEGDRIAKVLSRAGVASRREAERMITEGRVSVNGKVIESPALNVTTQDRISVDGNPLPEAEEARLWLYYKPIGLVTTNSDEKGRTTIFDELPEDLPRVMTVGRLDINSEGLLLLTNDGGLKRKLELPETGWLRRYRVRINGRPKDEAFEPLRKGLVIDGERFQPMQVTLDRQQGANAWVTVGLREGRNREIRRAMEDIGFPVNRLLRLSYGPFQLGDLKPGEVEEVRRRVMRDQLGLQEPDEPKQLRPTRKGKPPFKKAQSGKPFVGKSTSGRSDSGRPGSGRPGSGKPGPGKPGLGKAGTGRPGTGKPGLGKPSSAKPAAGKTFRDRSDGTAAQSRGNSRKTADPSASLRRKSSDSTKSAGRGAQGRGKNSPNGKNPRR
ncbi:pseudouridine synthase [Tritonibacter aquimaris]|nr:pseudouridine synthase [Tritonibacter aquimaris]